MARRSRRKERAQKKGPTRKHRSRSLREQKERRRVLLGMAAVGALLVLVFGVGVIREYILEPTSPIAAVGKQEVRVDSYQHRVQFNRYQLQGYINQLQAQLQQLDPSDKSTDFLRQYYEQNLQQLQTRYVNLPSQVIDDMIDELLVQERAEAEGITVSEADVDEEIQRQLAAQAGSLIATDVTATAIAGVAASATAALWTPTPIPSPTATLTATTAPTDTVAAPPSDLGPPPPTPTVHTYTADEFQSDYETFLASLKSGPGISESEFRQMTRASLLRQKLQEVMAQQVPTEDEQIHARHILVETEEEAQAVLERLAAGEEFAAIAQEVSKDTGSKDDGGDLGWFARGQMVSPFEEAAFALEPGEISDPVATSFGYHIIELLEGPEARPLDAAALQRRQQSALSDWLDEARLGPDVQRFWSPEDVPPDPFETQRTG